MEDFRSLLEMLWRPLIFVWGVELRIQRPFRFMKLCLFVVIFSIVSATFISGTFLRVLASFVIGFLNSILNSLCSTRKKGWLAWLRGNDGRGWSTVGDYLEASIFIGVVCVGLLLLQIELQLSLCFSLFLLLIFARDWNGYAGYISFSVAIL